MSPISTLSSFAPIVKGLLLWLDKLFQKVLQLQHCSLRSLGNQDEVAAISFTCNHNRTIFRVCNSHSSFTKLRKNNSSLLLKLMFYFPYVLIIYSKVPRQIVFTALIFTALLGYYNRNNPSRRKQPNLLVKSSSQLF